MYDEKYQNAQFFPYHIVINESGLPDGPRESLKKLRQSLNSWECEYCRRTGTLIIESNIYEDRSKVHFPDGTEKDEHTCYKVHAVCKAEHNTEYSGSYNTHVHCFYLHPQGKIGFSTGCGKTHKHG